MHADWLPLAAFGDVRDIALSHAIGDERYVNLVPCESRHPIVSYDSSVKLDGIREMTANLAAILSPLSPYRKCVT